MHIDDYFRQLRKAIHRARLDKEPDIECQVRSPVLGYVRGNVTFLNGSILYIREFVDVEETITRLTYAYQYMTAERILIFRYDDSPHHPQLVTHPHHKHDGSEENVIASSAPTLTDVLDEIEGIIDLY